MFQLLKKRLVFLIFYLCCVPVCCDVKHVSGTAGQNLTVAFTMKSTNFTNRQMNIYRDNTKIHVFNKSNGPCFSWGNYTLSKICITHPSQNPINLIFTYLLDGGVYHLAVFMPDFTFEESNKVNLTVLPSNYTTTNITAASFNNTSFQLDQSDKTSRMLMFIPVLVVVVMLVIVLLGSFYWSYRRKTDKTPAVNSTSTPQAIPDVTCVDYCVLDLPNRAGEKVRSTEERVEYSPIVFPPRKTTSQDNEIKSTTQQNKIKMTKQQRKQRETDKVSENPKTSKPKHHKCKNNSHLVTSCQVQNAQV
ncbi:uncharacterized protein LOC108270544 [Ictalurus punctatus]|uniref:Uncharacterized protein LOC108270544 n=1 Tax=Ictalurus punctatus TaxID=7998 RepID=A0A2D0RQQ8_ICTPU|nr:uncharacterized protein LOC108270544 [Ictalurus punctatus]